MNRRRLLLALAALATPLSINAQQPSRPRRVAIIGIGDLKGQPLASLVRGMRELGYHEGRNVEYLPPIARGGYEDLAGLASAAVKRDAEVMVTYGSTATKAAKAATSSIPIVMHVGVDPARAGLVSNLARPESNVTGIVSATRLLAGKQVEVLKDTLPHMRRLAVLWSSTSAGQAETIKLVEAAAAKLGVTIIAIEVNRSEDMKMLPVALSEARADALLPVASILLSSLRSDVVRIAAERKIPAMYASTEFVRSGGLMSYSTDQSASFYRCATYVDRLLKGVKPAELPVEQPAKFEFAINLKTAKALGIEIPKAVLFRADEVIE